MPRVLVPSVHTVRVYYILTCVGIDSVRSIEKAVVGQSHGTGSSRYPAFRMWFNKVSNYSGAWVSVGAHSYADDEPGNNLRYRVILVEGK